MKEKIIQYFIYSVMIIGVILAIETHYKNITLEQNRRLNYIEEKIEIQRKNDEVFLRDAEYVKEQLRITNERLRAMEEYLYEINSNLNKGLECTLD